jgi:hypothetical protein
VRQRVAGVPSAKSTSRPAPETTASIAVRTHEEAVGCLDSHHRNPVPLLGSSEDGLHLQPPNRLDLEMRVWPTVVSAPRPRSELSPGMGNRQLSDEDVPMTTTRGTTNGNARGSAESRRRRREWLVKTYRANVDLRPGWSTEGPIYVEIPLGTGLPACRCFRCGFLLTVNTVTVDRIVAGCHGGTYRRNNIRPACLKCNSETGGALRAGKKAA